jgi:hypothetical protein
MIVGGGGRGATAHAVLSCSSDPNECAVAGIKADHLGSGYILPPTVTFNPPDANGDAVVLDGKVVGISMQKRGCYSTPPVVTISGGRTKGRDAAAQAVL